MAEPRHFAEDFPPRPVPVKPDLATWLAQREACARANPTQVFPVPTNTQALRCGCTRPSPDSRNLRVRWSPELGGFVCVVHQTVNVGSTHPTGTPASDGAAEAHLSPVATPASPA